MWKSTQVSELVARQSGFKVSNSYVSRVLRDVLRMRYKRVVPVAPQANSEAALVKRMDSARVLLRELQKGKRCLNIDESAIGAMDFRRQKWTVIGKPNSIVQKDVTPRLTIIAAIDNLGGVYFSMVQANVDGEVFTLFLTKLVQKLT